jgi:hypothetical protein
MVGTDLPARQAQSASAAAVVGMGRVVASAAGPSVLNEPWPPGFMVGCAEPPKPEVERASFGGDVAHLLGSCGRDDLMLVEAAVAEVQGSEAGRPQ